MVNLPQLVALQVEALAEMDNRPVSNWIHTLIEKHIRTLSPEEETAFTKLINTKFAALPPEAQKAAAVDLAQFLG